MCGDISEGFLANHSPYAALTVGVYVRISGGILSQDIMTRPNSFWRIFAVLGLCFCLSVAILAHTGNEAVYE